ncbi:MAG TPA: oxidoreductase [Lactobacillus sp.]|nr:oxidoreductase [Lactobacillus sp.]
MKKIIVDNYGSVDVLKEINVSIPTPQENQILIKTRAIGVNDPDIVMRKNGPFPTMPKEMRPTLPHMLGQDFSGVIVKVGDGVTKFHEGDHVIGFSKNGTYAQYLLLDQNDPIAKVASDLGLVPLGALYLQAATAWGAVIRDGHLKAGQKVLIHGGAGGVGTMAIQLAKNVGAYVITTAQKKHNEYLKQLGADEIIDYKTQDFTKLVNNVDLVVNLTGDQTLTDSYGIVKRGGRITLVHGVPDKKKASDFGINTSYSLSDLSPKTLDSIVKLYTDSKLKVNIDRIYPFNLESVKQAHLDFEEGSNQGKKVVVFDD